MDNKKQNDKNNDTLEIIKDEKNHKFYCTVDSHECIAEYSIDGNIIEFYHTFVHPELRGRGIAEKLFDKAKEFVIEKNLKVHPTCSFARKYFEEKGKGLIV
jgi:predicted GNAT family acetyltransferase